MRRTLIFFLVFAAGLRAQTFQVDPAFSPVLFDGGSASPLVQPDGRMLINRFLARLLPDGTPDPTYTPTGLVVDAAQTARMRFFAFAPDGKPLLWVQNGSLPYRLIRLKANGDLDAIIVSASRNESGAVQPDGKLLLKFGLIEINGQTFTNGLLRLNPDGSIDTTFDVGRGGDVRALATLPDGKILVSGYFTSFDGVPRSAIARLNSNGTVDTSFDAGFTGSVSNFVVQPDKHLIVDEYVSSTDRDGNPQPSVHRLVRRQPDGALERIVSDLGQSISTGLMLQSDGDVLVSGDFTVFQGLSRSNLARIHADGSIDANFNPSAFTTERVYGTGIQPNGRATVLGVQPDGAILVWNDAFVPYGIYREGRLVRLKPDGTPDLSFAAGVRRVPTTLAVSRHADGRIAVGGAFIGANGSVRPGLARLRADGTLDAGFTPPSEAIVQVDLVAALADGAVLAAGQFARPQTANRQILARFLGNGAFDSAFAPAVSTGGKISALVPLPDGRVVAAGSFTAIDGQPRNNLAAFSASGALDPTVGALATTNGEVKIVAPRAGGGLFIAGDFTLVDGARRNGLAALTSSGALDPAFNPTVLTSSDHVTALAALPDGGVVIGGPKLTANRSHLRRLTNTGELDTRFTFTLDVNATFQALAADDQGRVVASYTDNEANVDAAAITPYYFVQRFNADGSLDRTFNAGAGPTQPVTSILRESDDSMILAGGFDAFDDIPRSGLVRLRAGAASAAPTPLLNLSARARVSAGVNALIGGFVIGGTVPKTVLIRAAGPSLANYGVTDVLALPTLSLYRAGSPDQIASNGLWSLHSNGHFFGDYGFNVAMRGDQVGAFPLQPNSEAALVMRLEPGAYTAQIASSSSGNALLEVYALNVTPGDRRLLNISARGNVSPGEGTLIAGFVIGGTQSRRVLVRAIGPTLTGFAVANPLADPTLTIMSAAGSPLASNDNWGGGSDLTQAFTATGAFSLPADSKDAALIVTLPPGAYTAVVGGVGNATGPALVEVYDYP